MEGNVVTQRALQSVQFVQSQKFGTQRHHAGDGCQEQGSWGTWHLAIQPATLRLTPSDLPLKYVCVNVDVRVCVWVYLYQTPGGRDELLSVLTETKSQQ